MACRVVLSATGNLELQKATRDRSTRINKQTKIHIYLVHSLHKQKKKRGRKNTHKSKITTFKKRRKKISLNRARRTATEGQKTKPNNFVAYVYMCTVSVSSISSSRQKGKRKEPSRPHHVSHLVQNPNPTNVRGDDVYVIYILTSFSNPKEKKKNKSAQKREHWHNRDL